MGFHNPGWEGASDGVRSVGLIESTIVALSRHTTWTYCRTRRMVPHSLAQADRLTQNEESVPKPDNFPSSRVFS
jgi:hypothetical protein